MAHDSRHGRLLLLASAAATRWQARVGLVLALVAAAVGAAPVKTSGQAPRDLYQPPEVLQLQARTIRSYPVPEANQGVAADGRFFYAIDNTVIAKYEMATGRRAGGWAGPRNGLVRHLNSCLAHRGRLWCANSNYPLTPMGSSVEVFDTETMRPVESHSLGLTDEGSLTWFDRYREGWIAGFAHYDGTGGIAGRPHTFSSVVTFDAAWRRTGGWLFPASVLERMAPYAASGGALGPDGFLYLLGHDRPELYVVARPPMGPTLVHIATIAVEAEGQAFGWAGDGSRTIFTIDRRLRQVRSIDVPPVSPADPGSALRFE
jgi:hypothetical protein